MFQWIDSLNEVINLSFYLKDDLISVRKEKMYVQEM